MNEPIEAVKHNGGRVDKSERDVVKEVGKF